MNLTRDRVSRGEKILDELVQKTQLTPSGHDFLLAALDPMHDNQLKNLEGWPDVETASSVVRCVKQSITVSVPVAIAGNWDCSVVVWPFMSSTTAQNLSRSNNLVSYAGAPPGISYGGVSIYCVAAGTPVNYFLQPAQQITLADVYSQGASRIVGVGVELVNTTSALYKQGQLAVWRQPNGDLDPTTYVINNAAGVTVGSFSGVQIMSPPSTLPLAMLIPGTRQWEAAQGAYIVGSYVGQDNPPALVKYTQPLLTATNIPEATISLFGGATPNAANANTSNLLVPNSYDVPGSATAVMQAQKLYPIHQMGIFNTGLSNQTTFTVTLNVYLETFPTTSEPDILVLATPSAQYDPVALEVFSRCLSVLPVGVPANMNPLGEWFAKVVSEVTDWLAPGLGLINPALGMVATGANKLAKSYLAAPTPNSKPATKPPLRAVTKRTPVARKSPAKSKP